MEKPQELTGRKWVFWTGDGTYFIGSFDGYRFTQEYAGRKANAMNSLPYAAQTFSGTEEVLSISWLCTKCIGLQTTGAMSLPRVLSLVQNGDAYVLSQKLPERIEKASQHAGEITSVGECVTVEKGAALRMHIHSKKDWTICVYSEDGKEQFTISYRYLGGSFLVTYHEVTTFVLLGGSCDQLDLIFDKGIMEIVSEDGILLAVNDIAELRTNSWNKVSLQKGEALVSVEFYS